MEPTQTQTAQPPQGGTNYTATDGTQLNPTAVTLAKAIRSVESGGNYNAVGDNGQSHGAYQFNKGNFQAWAQQYGLNPNDMSPVNQDKVAYARINSLLQKGVPPSQVAAIWNGAKYQNGQYQAINPAYVDKVKNAYQQQLQQTSQSSAQNNGLGTFTPQTQTESTPPPATGTTQTPSTDKGFWGNLTSGNLLGAAGDAGNFLFPIVGDVGGDISGTNKKTVLQQAGDLGTSALSAIAAASLLPESVIGAGATGLIGGLTGAGAETALGRIGSQAAFGGAMGLTGALGQGQTDPTKIAESTALGGATGGIVGGASELLSKAADALPQRIVKSFIPKINSETADYAISKGLASPAKMLEDSNSSLASLGNTLRSALSHPQYDGITATANDIIPSIIEKFPNAGLNTDSVGAALEKVVPLQKSLVQKLVSGDGLNLEELQTLKSAIGKNTYKTVLDDPVVKAGKDLANAFYQSASNYIKTTAPETAPIIDQLSKEIPLNNGLQRAVNSASKGQKLSLKDIMALMAGFTGAGPVGAGAAYAGEKILTNPTVNLKAAGLLSKLGAPAIQAASTPITGLLSRFASSMTQ